jgi:hypothetical protein
MGFTSPTRELCSVEALSEMLRRAAGFMCPCPRNKLVDAVSIALRGLVETPKDFDDTVGQILNQMIAYGDLVESRGITHQEAGSGTLIYAASPSFVRRLSGAVMLIGIAPDNVSPLPDDLRHRVEYVGHVRRLALEESEDLAAHLVHLGFSEISQDNWLRMPQIESATRYLRRLNDLLDKAITYGEVRDLTLLDPTTSVRYYRDRWVPARAQSGRFVARRSQLYGAKLWCYIDIENGSVRRLLDLPLPGSSLRGCDEAWRLQASIDSERHAPQQFRVRAVAEEIRELDLFSPVPAWAERRWLLLGAPVRPIGCLCSYRFSVLESQQEILFLKERLWHTQVG